MPIDASRGSGGIGPPPQTPPPPAQPLRPAEQLAQFARDIKLSHTVFALPFALLSTFLAGARTPEHWPRLGQLGLILVCMVMARTVAMAANRLLDAELDRSNPRTAGRALPSGRLSRAFVGMVLTICAIAFLASTAGFGMIYANWWPLALSVPVLLCLSAYPFLKRFTQLCHFYLGAALALAPVCAWIAILGRLDLPPLLMAAAVLCWTAGFDIIYACQDYQHDVSAGLFSVPARLGIAPALWVSRATHIVAIAMLVGLGISTTELSFLYFAGAGLAAGLLIVEHLMVRPDDLSKVGIAFFTINGIISLLLGTLGILDVFF